MNLVKHAKRPYCILKCATAFVDLARLPVSKKTDGLEGVVKSYVSCEVSTKEVFIQGLIELFKNDL